jgi:hypothetical protein
MQKSIIRTLGLGFFLLLFSFNIVLAQDAETTDVDLGSNEVIEDVVEDEEVTADDLEIERPKILPDSPWYGFKKLLENAQEAFTWNPVKKAQLQIDRANERILEAQILAEETGNIDKLDEIISKYQARIEKVETRIDNLKEKHGDKIDGLLDKFTEHQLRHQKIFEKIEELTPEKKEKILMAKDKALEKLGNALSKLDNEKVEQRIIKAMEKVEGSSLKNFKNIEILKALSGKVPNSAKDAIERAISNTFIRLGNDLNDIPEGERQERLQKYVENIGGDSVRHLEILNELEDRSEIPLEVRAKLMEIKNRAIDKIEVRLDSGDGLEFDDIKHRLENQPELRRVIERIEPRIINRIDKIESLPPREDSNNNDDTRHRLGVPEFECLCTGEYVPVCGENGRTYANACVAECARVSIEHRGACQSDDVRLEPGDKERLRDAIERKLDN